MHECGHALVAMLMDDYPEVDKITIVPRGDALGYVSNILDERFLYSMTKRDIINRIDVALGGRAAEELILGYWFWKGVNGSEDAISTGASNDLEKATNYAISMAYQWGMTKVPPGRALHAVWFTRRPNSAESVFVETPVLQSDDNRGK